MLPEKIQRIADVGGFQRAVAPLKEGKRSEAEIIGFDTEYDSKTGALVSFQLAGDGWAELFTGELSVERLICEASRRLEDWKSDLCFVTYFSLAELQFLPVFQDATRFFVGGRGSLDAEFCWRRRRALVFDLSRWFDGQSLAAAAKTIGQEKLEWDTTRVTKGDLKNAKFRAYAIRDAEIAWGLGMSLRNSFGFRGADPTAVRTPASASATVFRLQYLSGPLLPPPRRCRYLGLRSCWGGRTEVYRRGRHDRAFEYDLSSAYPNAAIFLGELPNGNDWRQLESGESLRNLRGGFARAAFRFPDSTRFPCLPVVHGGYQLYPLEGVSFCTFDEIRLAQEMGACVEILDAWGFCRGDDSFPKYLAEIVEKRKTAVGAERHALKLLANSIIGKLCQATDDFSLNDIRKASERAGISMYDVLSLDPMDRLHFGVRRKTSLGALFYPEWNALITGHVRAQLGRMIWEHGAIYSATDAFWTTKAIEPVPPGWELKREGPATTARTRLAAIWSKPAHVVHHSFGRRAPAADVLSRFNGSVELSRAYKLSRPRKALESLRLGLPLGKWTVERRSGNTKWDGKRKLLPGGETRPWKNLGEFLTWKEKFG